MLPPLFKGSPAVAVMCSGRLSDLSSVLRYLEAEGLGPT